MVTVTEVRITTVKTVEVVVAAEVAMAEAVATKAEAAMAEAVVTKAEAAENSTVSVLRQILFC
jgi:hypothetical protein